MVRVVDPKKKVKVALYLPPALYKEMQHMAIDQECSIGELVEKIWLGAKRASGM